MKVKSMIVISAILFAICPLIISSVLAGYLVTSNAGSRVNSIIKSIAESGSVNLQSVINMANNDVSSISEYPAIKSIAAGTGSTDDMSVASDFLKRFLSENKLVTSVNLTNSSGNIIAGSNMGNTLMNFEKLSEYPENTLCFDDATGETQNASMVIKKRWAAVGCF